MFSIKLNSMSNFYDLSKLKKLLKVTQFCQDCIYFLEEMPKDTAALEQSYEDTDYEQVYQLAHKMKPTVELFGLGVLDEVVLSKTGEIQKSDVCIKKQMVIVLDQFKLLLRNLEKFN